MVLVVVMALPIEACFDLDSAFPTSLSPFGESSAAPGGQQFPIEQGKNKKCQRRRRRRLPCPEEEQRIFFGGSKRSRVGEGGRERERERQRGIHCIGLMVRDCRKDFCKVRGR